MRILNLLSIRNPTANWWIDDHGLALMVSVTTVDITQNGRTVDETVTRLASGPRCGALPR
ncbi:hypothetical protein [Streptomyces lanatus]|uniref:Uncharacterized protein n=1 Tax=Streptomyces lanatus TaxID=66900 RepID=A0ABV1Y782_9ACTN|nr:hypothetical protein [Streptomyces lanatus]GHH29811.1 hypothetical protein GCM10018780_88340 [Streptomyces lanatus]